MIPPAGLIAQLVMCLTADTCLTADPGVVSLILTRYILSWIDPEIISTAIPFPDSRRVVVSYKQKYVHEVLVYPLVKLIKERSVAR